MGALYKGRAIIFVYQSRVYLEISWNKLNIDEEISRRNHKMLAGGGVLIPIRLLIFKLPANQQITDEACELPFLLFR